MLHTMLPPSARAQRLESLARELSSPITCDGLTADFFIFQRRRGHRHSTDDLLTAWYADLHAPRAPEPRLLDLGSGIGSIGLALMWLFASARLTAVEAQEVSFRLLQENIALNGVGGRVQALHGDLRHCELEGPFDLITGSPPYFNVSDGIVSADSQRAHARFELRGDITDYARAAARVLAPEGRFVFCFPTVQGARAIAACRIPGLRLVSLRDVIPRRGTPALFSLFACAPGSSLDDAPPHVVEPPFVVREADGSHTAEMTAARARFGMPRSMLQLSTDD